MKQENSLSNESFVKLVSTINIEKYSICFKCGKESINHNAISYLPKCNHKLCKCCWVSSYCEKNPIVLCPLSSCQLPLSHSSTRELLIALDIPGEWENYISLQSQFVEFERSVRKNMRERNDQFLLSSTKKHTTTPPDQQFQFQSQSQYSLKLEIKRKLEFLLSDDLELCPDEKDEFLLDKKDEKCEKDHSVISGPLCFLCFNPWKVNEFGLFCDSCEIYVCKQCKKPKAKFIDCVDCKKCDIGKKNFQSFCKRTLCLSKLLLNFSNTNSRADQVFFHVTGKTFESNENDSLENIFSNQENLLKLSSSIPIELKKKFFILAIGIFKFIEYWCCEFLSFINDQFKCIFTKEEIEKEARRFSEIFFWSLFFLKKIITVNDEIDQEMEEEIYEIKISSSKYNNIWSCFYNVISSTKPFF